MKRILNTIFLSALVFLTITNAQEYTIEVIQEAGGIENAYANSINNNGLVVGTGNIPNYGQRAFVYENGVMSVIYYPAFSYYEPLSINDNNNYVGTVGTTTPPYSSKGYLNSEFLPPLSGNDSYAIDINNDNHILSWGWDGQDYFIVIYQDTQIIHTFNLGSINGADPKAINDSGFVTGTDWPGGYGIPYIYNYLTGDLTYLADISPNNDVEAFDINNINQVVGYYEPTSTTYAGFIWEDNIYTLLPISSLAWAINDSGVVVGSYDYHAFVYDPANSVRDLNNLIPAGTGWLLVEATDINDLGQIVGDGTLNGVYKSFILTPNKLTVTKPSAGELFIAGETDTIKWHGEGNIDSIKITAILNWNTTSQSEIVLDTSAPANEEEFLWNIPDTLLSYKTKIKIEDNTNPSDFGESQIFKLKGYVLTRLKSDLTYEKFGRTKDAWQFGNAASNLWPSTWWSQFNYRTSIDPYTNDFYDDEFHKISANVFPDWFAFVRAFGVNQCYWNVPFLGLFYRDAAINFWKSKIGRWRGSCFGFTISSLLSFDDKNAFVTAYPEMPPYNNLYQFPNPLTGTQGDSIRAIINSLQVHQNGKQHKEYFNNLLADNPNQTLNKIKNTLLLDNSDGRGLLIYNQGVGGGAHAIFVYKVTQNQATPNLYTLLVYDNSNPTVFNATITIDTMANGGNGNWNFPLWVGWGGNSGIYLADPIDSYLSFPVLPNGPLDSYMLQGSLSTEIYNSRTNEIIITDSLGSTSGFVDSTIINNIQGAIPLMELEPSYEPPSGYHLPFGIYRIKISSFTDSTAFLYLFNDDVTYSYRRDDASSIQEDHLNVGSGFSFSTNDQTSKKIELKTTISEIESEKVFLFKDISIASGDSIFIKQENKDHFTFKNYGSQKYYSLRIKYSSDTFRHIFEHSDISVELNSTHILYPMWDSLSATPVKILIDYGNDGTIDDSIFVGNQSTDVRDQIYFGIPSNYYLSQNYPNPFNPLTKIRFGVPQAQYVSLKVYDILGREVTTLVSEEKQSGSYEVEVNLTSLPSGIYFYTLNAGNYSETKKMILLK